MRRGGEGFLGGGAYSSSELSRSRASGFEVGSVGPIGEAERLRFVRFEGIWGPTEDMATLVYLVVIVEVKVLMYKADKGSHHTRSGCASLCCAGINCSRLLLARRNTHILPDVDLRSEKKSRKPPCCWKHKQTHNHNHAALFPSSTSSYQHQLLSNQEPEPGRLEINYTGQKIRQRHLSVIIYQWSAEHKLP